MGRAVKKPKKKPTTYADEVFPRDLYLLPVKIRPVFPGIITPFTVNTGKYFSTLDDIYENDGFIGLNLLQDEFDGEETPENLYDVGVIARILKKINLPDGGTNILVNTLARFRIRSFIKEAPMIQARVNYLAEFSSSTRSELKALMRTMFTLTRELAENNPLFTEEMKLTLVNLTEPGKMADFVGSILNLEKEEYQSILETEDVFSRLEKVIIFLKKEIELLAIQQKINDKINDKLDKQQKQFFLREQLKAIQGELGDIEEKPEKKYNSLLERLQQLELEPTIIQEIEREIDKLNYTDPNSSDFNVIRNYLDTIDALPWEEPQTQEINLKNTQKILNRDHYKLEEVKERILEFLAVKKLNPQNNGSILCLIGPPGVGKTSIVQSIAESLGRKFFRFSLGGVRDEAEIKGHRRTYVGAMPGKIIGAMRSLQTRDPVILLDEIDKISIGNQGDPASALLEVLDAEQNHSFRDHYLDLPFDLSRILFIATANSSDTIPAVLLDRMDVIPISGYISEEKVQIFKKYLWKKVSKKTGIYEKKITLDNQAIYTLANSYSREAGMRGMERMSEKIARKLALKLVQGEKIATKIQSENLIEYLGKPIFTNERLTRPSRPGIAIGLAYTNYGGATLPIETLAIDGKPGIVLTGKLGETMNESANIAFHYIRSLIPGRSFFHEKTIHIHVPDGATPKDGPSAGTAIALALLSLAKNKQITGGMAMTGELTLVGEVLPVGGLREKLTAARRVGIKKIIYPQDNLAHIEEIPPYIKKGLKLYPVHHFEQIIKLVFGKSIPL